ncbi:hypothetical protein [Saccharopolyspora sp. NPDC049426]|uniref:hypothetical protein n=1 Tax=Saccharopolyspora sp. NPDC049426 TaxID=3155652 RepID=UPI0034467250
MTLTESPETATSRRPSKAFDVRLIIALLFGLYGLMLTALGLFTTTPADVAKAAGLNINLWTGVGMLAFTALVTTWALMRPLRLGN